MLESSVRIKIRASEYILTVTSGENLTVTIDVQDKAVGPILASTGRLPAFDIQEAIRRAPAGNGHQYSVEQYIVGNDDPPGKLIIVTDQTGQNTLVIGDMAFVFDTNILSDAITSCTKLPEIKWVPTPLRSGVIVYPETKGTQGIPGTQLYVNGQRVR